MLRALTDCRARRAVASFSIDFKTVVCILDSIFQIFWKMIFSCSCRGIGKKSLVTFIALSMIAGGLGKIDPSMVCGKKFRIATHLIPPYINILNTQCSNQKCPEGAGLGITYDYVSTYLKNQLKVLCQASFFFSANFCASGILTAETIQQFGHNTDVEFDWYIPETQVELEQSPLNMMCSGDFRTLPTWSEEYSSKASCFVFLFALNCTNCTRFTADWQPNASNPNSSTVNVCSSSYLAFGFSLFIRWSAGLPCLPQLQGPKSCRLLQLHR